MYRTCHLAVDPNLIGTCYVRAILQETHLNGSQVERNDSKKILNLFLDARILIDAKLQM